MRVFSIAVFLCLFMITTDIAYCSDGDSTKITYDPEMTREATDSLVDRLFIQASSGEIKYRDLVQPSKDSIAALGKKALPRMCAKLTSRDARER